MNTHPYYGPGNVLIDTCDRCDVIWLDYGELARAVNAPGRDRGAGSGQMYPETRVGPVCRRILNGQRRLKPPFRRVIKDSGLPMAVAACLQRAHGSGIIGPTAARGAA